MDFNLLHLVASFKTVPVPVLLSLEELGTLQTSVIPWQKGRELSPRLPFFDLWDIAEPKGRDGTAIVSPSGGR